MVRREPWTLPFPNVTWLDFHPASSALREAVNWTIIFWVNCLIKLKRIIRHAVFKAQFQFSHDLSKEKTFVFQAVKLHHRFFGWKIDLIEYKLYFDVFFFFEVFAGSHKNPQKTSKYSLHCIRSIVHPKNIWWSLTAWKTEVFSFDKSWENKNCVLKTAYAVILF